MPPQLPQEPQQPNIQPQPQAPSANSLTQYPNPSGPQAYDQPKTQSSIQQTQEGMFSGRLNRLGYFMAFVFIVVYFLVPLVLQLSLRHSGASGMRAAVNIVTLILGLIGVVLLIPAGISINIRRWHDLGKSGWFILLGLIPLVGYVLPIILLLVPGTQGANNYGDPDMRPSSIGKVLFNK